MRNSQCCIIQAFEESSTYSVYGQPDMSLTINTHPKWYHCMKKVITGDIFYNFPKEKQYRKSHSLTNSLNTTHINRERAAVSSVASRVKVMYKRMVPFHNVCSCQMSYRRLMIYDCHKFVAISKF